MSPREDKILWKLRLRRAGAGRALRGFFVSGGVESAPCEGRSANKRLRPSPGVDVPQREPDRRSAGGAAGVRT